MMDSEPFRSLFCWAMVLLEMLFLVACLIVRFVSICTDMMLLFVWGCL